MKKSSISVTTVDNLIVNFKLRHLKSIYANNIVIRMSYCEWLKSGKFDDRNYDLTPESLKYLLYRINDSKKDLKLSTLSSESFLKSFPTSEKYIKYIKEIDSLPITDK